MYIFNGIWRSGWLDNNVIAGFRVLFKGIVEESLRKRGTCSSVVRETRVRVGPVKLFQN